MHSHLVVFFPEKQYVITKNKCNHLVKLENRVEASDKKSSERIILFEIVKYNFLIRHLYRVEFL